MTPSYFVTLYNVFRSPMGTEIVIFTGQSDKVKLYNNIQQAGCRLHRASLAVNYLAWNLNTLALLHVSFISSPSWDRDWVLLGFFNFTISHVKNLFKDLWKMDVYISLKAGCFSFLFLFQYCVLRLLLMYIASISKLRNSTKCHNSQENYRWSPVTAQRHCFGLGFSQIILKWLQFPT